MVRKRGSDRAKLVEILKKQLPNELIPLVPHRWWRIGDIAIIPIPEKLIDYKNNIGEALLSIDWRIKTVLGKIGPTKGIVRTPEFMYLSGNPNTETIHRELGCRFKIDAARLMFSPGNHGERKRMIDLVSKGEIIIDMFACIGNLSLPIAVNKAPKKIIAAEINPLAFRYLEENIHLNKVEDRMTAILGDNRFVLKPFEDKADRVISGYLESDDEQVRCAIRLCRKGAMLHYHEATPAAKEKRNRPIVRIMELAKQEKRAVRKIEMRRVKKYSPGVEHFVVDAIIF